jgi:hypothetical protein
MVVIRQEEEAERMRGIRAEPNEIGVSALGRVAEGRARDVDQMDIGAAPRNAEAAEQTPPATKANAGVAVRRVCGVFMNIGDLLSTFDAGPDASAGNRGSSRAWTNIGVSRFRVLIDKGMRGRSPEARNDGRRSLRVKMHMERSSISGAATSALSEGIA